MDVANVSQHMHLDGFVHYPLKVVGRKLFYSNVT